jgi:cytochrome o ubiquinol oxidase subunit II
MHTSVLAPAGPIAGAERLILINATEIMLVIILPVIVGTLAFAWWYRDGNPRAAYRPTWDYSGQIELVMWSIPIMVILLLAGVIWIGSHELDPRSPVAGKGEPLRIQVVSLDWKWLFLLPDQHLASVNEITVPVGRPLRFELTSSGVMNAFFIPTLGTQIYTMPGMTSHLNLRADRTGDVQGFSSMYSGDGFSDMWFTVHAVPPAEFDAWAAAHANGQGRFDEKAYADLARRGTAAPRAWADLQPDLWGHILQVSAVHPLSPPRHGG